MPDKTINPDQELTKKEQETADGRDVIDQHLQDENHVITDEHIRNYKVGVKDDVPEGTREEMEKRFEDEDSASDKESSSGNRVTPWDVVSE